MRKLASIVFCITLVPVLCGASEPGFHLKKDAEPFPTLKDLSLLLPGESGNVTFYGQNRFRWHSWDYFESEPFDNAYNYFANQLRLGTGLQNSLLKAHVAWQVAQTWLLPSGTSAGAGSGSLYFSNGTAQNETHGTYLKYAEIHSKDVTGLGITAGVGRMDYSSGNRYVTGSGKGVSKEDTESSVTKKMQWLKSTRIAERMIGGFGWSEYQRSFDGGYGAWDHEKFNFQVAAMNPTQGGFDENAGHTLHDIDLLASELTFKKGGILPDAEIQAFYYSYADSRQMTAATARRDNAGRTVPVSLEYDVDVQMIGGHLAGASALGDGLLDTLFWGGYQFGNWFELDHSAFALAAEAGYQWKNIPWKPWIRGGYNIGSGDSDAQDGKHTTFYQMLPTARLYSFSILYNTMNTEDAFISLILKPAEPLTVRSDVHWVNLSDKSDRWYLGSGEITDGNAAGYAVRSSNGEESLGTLWDISASYKVCASTTVSIYYGHFFGGDVVEKFYSKKSDADFFYVEWALNF
jgi:hypothetical protein